MGAAEAIAFARAQIGKPYQWGTTGPNTYDCSGLVLKACEAGGVHIGRTTYDQILDGTPVSKSELLPGDLVFPDSGHVQLYAGNNMVIEAPHTGAFVREVAMWGFWQARRVFSDGATFTGSGGSGVTPAFNPLDPLGLTSKIPVLGQLEGIAGVLTNAAFWRRVGVAALGGMVILLGILFINRKRLENLAVEGAKTGAKVAEVAAL